MREVLATVKLPTILFTRAREISGLSQAGAPTWIRVEGVSTTRTVFKSGNILTLRSSIRRVFARNA